MVVAGAEGGRVKRRGFAKAKPLNALFSYFITSGTAVTDADTTIKLAGILEIVNY